MAHKIGVIYPLDKLTRKMEIKDTEYQYCTEAALELLGDGCEDVDRINLSPDGTLMMFVDEAGYFNKRNFNFIIERNSELTPLLGPVIVIRIKPYDLFEEIWDYEVDDLTDDDIKLIESILEPFAQARMRSQFK